MKKAIVLLLAIAVVGAFAFAQDAKPYTISGNGTVTWGYNLNTNHHGFQNTYGITFDLPLVSGAGGGATGEGTYGKIDVSGIKINFSVDTEASAAAVLDSTDASISASVISGPITVTIFGGPGMSFANAVKFGPFNPSSPGTVDLVKPAAANAKGGLTIAYKLGDSATITAKIASTNDWTGAPVTSDQYNFLGQIDLTPVTGLSISAGALYDTETSLFGATGKVAYSAGALAAAAATDISMPSGADLAMDAKVDLSYKVTDTSTVGANAYIVNSDPLELDAKVYFDDTGIVPNLTINVAAFVNDILDDTIDPACIGVSEKLSYKIALSDSTYITPSEQVVYELDDAGLYMKFAVDAKFFANTVFTATYVAGAIATNSFPNGMVTTSAGSGTGEDMGLFTLACKVSF